jgi:hypothetical protein
VLEQPVVTKLCCITNYGMVHGMHVQITTRAAQRPAPTLDELVRSTGKVHQNGSDQYRHPSAWKVGSDWHVRLRLCDVSDLGCYSQVEGGRHKREAKIAALRYALEVEELSGATFTPQRHTRGWDKVHAPLCDQHLALQELVHAAQHPDS